MPSSREPSPLPSLDAAVGLFDIYEFIRPAFDALKICLQDGLDADSAYAALQSQMYFMNRFLTFAEVVDSEYLIPKAIHVLRQLHANIARHLSPEQRIALNCEEWIFDDPDRAALPLDFVFPQPRPGALSFTPKRQKQAAEFMQQQREESERRVAAQRAREECKRAIALREQAEREEAEHQRQAEIARQTEVDRQRAPTSATPDGELDELDPSPPPTISSKTAGKRKRAPNTRRSARQLAKSKVVLSEDEDAQPDSAGTSKRAKYAPSRPRTKILSQTDLLEKARVLWEQTPAGLRANAPPPFIDAAQLKSLRRGFRPQIKTPCFACVMGDTQEHCKFRRYNEHCAPCEHHKRGRCSFVWTPEERAHYREHAYSLGRDSLASFQDDLRDIQFHTSQGLISARQAETSFEQADRLAGKFTQRIIDLYNEDFPAALTRSVFTSTQCVDLVLKHVSKFDINDLGHHGLPLIDELLLFLDPNVFKDVSTTGWEHTVLQYRLYRESQEQQTANAAEHAEIAGLLDLEAQEAPSDEGSEDGSPRPSHASGRRFRRLEDEGESLGSRSEEEV
ncbi:hypothetical protein BDZ97DRAFT_1760697 [Flammula alnicola]|nr:hypothetical protein BDZ97DRAFT_1760697 [Flammula alnicola]